MTGVDTTLGPGRVLRRRHLQRLHPLPGRQGACTAAPTSRPATTRPTPSTTTTSRWRCCWGRPRMPRSPPSCGSRSMRRGPGSARATSPAPAPRSRPPSPPSRTSDFIYSAIGHGHLDMAWLWPLRETRRKAARTYTRRSTRSTSASGYIYGTSQPQQLYWIKQQHPALYERIKAAVADGRMELQGSFWVETDTNLPGGESLARQAMVGRRFLQQEFGLDDADLRLCWLPDTFGYNGNLPQILQQERHGLVHDHQARLEQGHRLPVPHLHLGGHRRHAEVLVHMAPEGDYNSPRRGRQPAHRAAAVPREGAQHGAADLRLGRRRRRAGRDPPRGHRSASRTCAACRGWSTRTAGDFFRALEKRDLSQLHTHAGELYLETHQGTYTTQAAIKKGNRVVERKLHNAEALAAIVGDDSRDRARADLARRCCSGTSTTSCPARRSSGSRARQRESLDRGRTASSTATSASCARGCRAPATRGSARCPQSDRTAARRVPEDGRRLDARDRGAVRERDARFPLQPARALTFADDAMSNGILSLRFGPTRRDRLVRRRGTASSTRPTGCPASCCTATPTSGRSTRGTSTRSYLKRTPRILPLRHVETVDRRPDASCGARRYRSAHGDRRAARRARGGQRRRAVRHHASSGTTKHRMLRAEFRPAHVGDTRALRDPVRAHLERVMTENTDGRGRAVRGRRAQVDRDRERRRRVRAAQRQQVRPPRQERADQPQPAARTHLPRSDGRPRVAQPSATRSPRSPAATSRR